MLNLLLGLLISAIPLPQKPVHYLTDHAGVLDAKRAAALEQKLRDFEDTTSNQVIVYIDRKVPQGTTPEEMGAQAIREWGIGQKGKDNGTIVFIFTEDRKMRIEVGYGLEGSLTDAKCKLITATVMKPRLQDGDYGAAAADGVDAILNTVGGAASQPHDMTVAEANAAAVASGRLREPPTAVVVPLGLAFFAALFAAVFFIRRRSGLRGFWFSRGGGSSSSSSSGSGGSSSSFSGGGGSGGGGGASDSW